MEGFKEELDLIFIVKPDLSGCMKIRVDTGHCGSVRNSEIARKGQRWDQQEAKEKEKVW